jgi:MFS family permease
VSRILDTVVPPRLGSRFRWLVASSWSSNLGDGIVLAAGPLLVASRTDDAFLVALAALLQWLPPLLFGLWAGAVTDRLDRRRLIILVDSVRTMVLLLLASAVVLDVATIWLVLVAMFQLGTAETFADNASSTLVPMLVQRDDGSLALATLSGVHDADALTAFTDASQGRARLLDLKGASESLVVAYRERILRALVLALGLLALTVIVALRSVKRAWHVLAPMSLATLLVLVVERASGISLSLFHLVALTLAAGLGLHYALFFERPVADAAEGRRTLHATIVCVLSALLVFGMQAWSSLPVLRAIGLTVALGVGFHFCLSILMARKRQGDT